MLRNIRTYISNTGELVSRFRSSHHYAARWSANFGIKGTLAIYDSRAVFGFEVPTQTRGYNDRNFKSTALAPDGLHAPNRRATFTASNLTVLGTCAELFAAAPRAEISAPSFQWQHRPRRRHLSRLAPRHHRAGVVAGRQAARGRNRRTLRREPHDRTPRARATRGRRPGRASTQPRRCGRDTELGRGPRCVRRPARAR